MTALAVLCIAVPVLLFFGGLTWLVASSHGWRAVVVFWLMQFGLWALVAALVWGVTYLTTGGAS